MIQEITASLCSVTRKLITTLEEEYDNLTLQEQPNDMIAKKHIIDMLNKLTNITLQLNKLNKEASVQEYVISKEEDEAIIAEFLRSYKPGGL